MPTREAPLVTVLTPTYNRAHMLPRLYASLLAQDAGGFDWLIVDDGSQDGTRELAAGWLSEGRLPIRYISRDNGGKHRALNTGLAHVSAPLVFIVDSDDTLLPDAISQIAALHARHAQDDSLCGYSFIKINEKGASVAEKPIGEGEVVATFAQTRLKERNSGDMAEVWFTEVLKRFPFPEFAGEKFYSEAGVWLRMSGPYKLVFVNTPIYRCEYYADGLTRNRAKAQARSPRGVLDCSKLLMTRQCGARANLKGALLYCVFSRKLGVPFLTMLKESGRPVLTLACALPSLPLARRWRDM